MLSDITLTNRINELHEVIDRLSDWVAEIRSEIARFGDSGPGTAAIIQEYNKAIAELNGLDAEYRKRFPQRFPIQTLSNGDVPF